MRFEIFNTHMEISPYEYGDFPIIESKFTAFDKMKQETYPCGYIIENSTLYLPRGAPVEFIESVIETKAEYVSEDDPRHPMNGFTDIIVEPRNEIQRQAIDFLTQDKPQLAFLGKTGFGKTFCTSYALTKVAEKTMIIVPMGVIRNQWLTTLLTQFRYREDRVMVLTPTVMDRLADGMIDDADVYITSHSSLYSYMLRHGGYGLHQLFRKLKIGVKIFDEAHKYFDNLLLIDFFTNTHRTWYLTATFGQSDKTRNECYLRAFSLVSRFGAEESKKVMPPHVIYHTRSIFSHPTSKQKSVMMAYPGFTAARYGKYAFFEDSNGTAYREILNILAECSKLEGKTMIFVPLIEAADKVYEMLKKDVPDKTIGIYHSKTPRDEKEEAESKDIIISTIKSSGTGRDVKGLRFVICCEPFASKIVAEQTLGRLRPLPTGEDCHYFDIVDRDIPPCNWWHRARYPRMKELSRTAI